MKIGRGKSRSALSVVHKIAEQQHMLAKAALFDSMKQLRDAESAQATLDEQMQQHYTMVSDSWRGRASEALRTTLNSLPYGQWLQSEIESAKQHAELMTKQVDESRERETTMRAEARLLRELEERRGREMSLELLKQSYKDVDEMILLTRRFQNAND
jgi:flagellar biosynthesis chaperone FliJ